MREKPSDEARPTERLRGLIDRFLSSPPADPPPRPQPSGPPLLPRASMIDRAVHAARDLAAQHRLAEACAVLEAARQQRPEDLRLLNNLGLLQYQMGRHEEAEACFVAALERYYRDGLPLDSRCAVIRDNLTKLRAMAGAGISDVLRDAFLDQIRGRLWSEERLLHCICGIVRVPVEVRPGPRHGSRDPMETADCSTVLAATNRRLVFQGQATLVRDAHGGTHPLAAVTSGRAPLPTRFQDAIMLEDLVDVHVAVDGARIRLCMTADDARERTLISAAREDVRVMGTVLLELLRRRSRVGLLSARRDRTGLAERLKASLRELEFRAGNGKLLQNVELPTCRWR